LSAFGSICYSRGITRPTRPLWRSSSEKAAGGLAWQHSRLARCRTRNASASRRPRFTRGERLPGFETKPVATPIYSAVAFEATSAAELDRVFGGTSPGYCYTRHGNPTCEALEETINRLEGGAGAIAFSSGMAALHAALLAAGVKSGGRLISSQDIYGATQALFRDVMKPLGVETRYAEESPTATRSALPGRSITTGAGLAPGTFGSLPHPMTEPSALATRTNEDPATSRMSPAEGGACAPRRWDESSATAATRARREDVMGERSIGLRLRHRSSSRRRAAAAAFVSRSVDVPMRPTAGQVPATASSRYSGLHRRFDARARRLPGDTTLVVRLQVEPDLGRGAEVLAESQRGISRNRAAGIDDGTDAVRRYGERPRQCVDVEELSPHIVR